MQAMQRASGAPNLWLRRSARSRLLLDEQRQTGMRARKAGPEATVGPKQLFAAWLALVLMASFLSTCDSNVTLHGPPHAAHKASGGRYTVGPTWTSSCAWVLARGLAATPWDTLHVLLVASSVAFVCKLTCASGLLGGLLAAAGSSGQVLTQRALSVTCRRAVPETQPEPVPQPCTHGEPASCSSTLTHGQELPRAAWRVLWHAVRCATVPAGTAWGCGSLVSTPPARSLCGGYGGGGAWPYGGSIRTLQLHLRLTCLQPEQLETDWEHTLRLHLVERGWCLLGATVRRGSICISLTLASLRARGRRPVGQPTPAAPGTPHAAVVPGDGVLAAAGVPPRAAVAGGLPDTASEVDPELLLHQLKLRKEDLPAGFQMTIQAFSDDGSCQRLRYSLASAGAWECQVLSSGFAAADAIGTPQDGGQEGMDADSGAGDGGPHGGPAGTDAPIWYIRTPFVVVGSTHGDDPGRSRSGGGSSGSGWEGASDCGSAAAVHNAGGDAGPVVTDRPVGFSSFEVYTFEVEALLAAAPPTAWRTELPAALWLCSTEPDTSGRSDGDGDCRDTMTGGLAARGRGCCPLEFRARPLGWDTGQRELLLREHLLPLPASVQPTSGAQAHAQLPPGPSSAGSETPSFSTEDADGAGGSGCVSRSWSINLRVPVPDTAGHGPPAQAPSGRLVDLSLWYGNELLAACVVLLVPPPPPSAPPPPQLPSSTPPPRRPHPAAVSATIDARGSGPDPVRSAVAQPAGGSPGWVDELRQVLSQQLPQVAHHVVMDMGMLLSGALAGRQGPSTTPRGLAAEDGAGQEGTAAAATAAAAGGSGACRSRAPYRGAGGATAPPMPGSSRAAAAFLAGQRALVMLDAGCSLLAFALQCAGCQLATKVWDTLLGSGYTPEEVLLHMASGAGGAPGAGPSAELPPLHAAVASASPQAVDLVLSWYASARLPEPWLHPVAVPGLEPDGSEATSPALLTPLILAVATQPHGALPEHILRTRPQAVAAWSVPVNRASGRSTALVAGMYMLVLRTDVRQALEPLAALWVAAAGGVGRVASSGARGLRAATGWARGSTTGGGGDAGIAHGTVSSTAAAPPDARDARSRWAKGRSPSTADAAATRVKQHGPAPVKQHGAEWARRSADPLEEGPTCGGGGKPLPVDFDRLVARDTRTQVLLVQWTIVSFQTLAHVKALLFQFSAVCPAAASASAAAATGHPSWTRTAAASVAAAWWPTLRCFAGVYWWTGVEVLFALWVSWVSFERHYTAVYCGAALMHVLYQGAEGSLLPTSRMTAHGVQMVYANIMFVLLCSTAYLPPPRLNALLRLVEGLASLRMLHKYGAASSLPGVVAVAIATQCMGWVVSALLRRRHARHLATDRRQDPRT